MERYVFDGKKKLNRQKKKL